MLEVVHVQSGDIESALRPLTSVNNPFFAEIVSHDTTSHLMWKYDSQSAADAVDPASWGDISDTCSSGRSQSPILIDIYEDDVQWPTEYVSSVWGVHFNHNMKGYLVNTGRVLRYISLGLARPTIYGGPLGDKV